MIMPEIFLWLFYLCFIIELSTGRYVKILACERAFTYNIFMTREQYIRILQRELDKLNQAIDMKIISGENYSKESKEHKLLLKKIYQHSVKSPFNNIFNRIFSHSSFQF